MPADAVLDVDGVAEQLPAVPDDGRRAREHAEGAVALRGVGPAVRQRVPLERRVVGVGARERRSSTPAATALRPGRSRRARVRRGRPRRCVVVPRGRRRHQRDDGDDDQYRQGVRAPARSGDEVAHPRPAVARRPRGWLRAEADTGPADALAGSDDVVLGVTGARDRSSTTPHGVPVDPLTTRLHHGTRHGRYRKTGRATLSVAVRGRDGRRSGDVDGRGPGVVEQRHDHARGRHRVLHHRGVPDVLEHEQPGVRDRRSDVRARGRARRAGRCRPTPRAWAR